MSHKLRLRYKLKDDRENAYWMEQSLPRIGKAMSVFVREVTTIDEDYHYLFGYAFIGLFSSSGLDSDTPGVTKELVISHVIPEHDPTTKQD